MPCSCRNKKGTASAAPEYATSQFGGELVVIAARSEARLNAPSGNYRVGSGGTTRIYLNEANGLITAGAPIWILQA